MNVKQAGFTLIELVMVIVILGILAAVAVPKFVDLSTEAKLAATQGVAGAVSSAFAVNYAIYAANSAKGVRISATDQAVGAAAGSVMLGGVPTGYTVTGAAVNCSSAGGTAAITVTSGAGGTSAPATLICTG